MSYDAQLRRSGATSRYGIVRALAYTDRGQLDTDTTTFGGKSYIVDYDYDDRGRLDEITYPSGRKVEYTFDDRSSLDLIKWDGSQIEDRDYNDLGLLTNVDRPFNDEVRGYDDLNRVTSIANTNVGDASYTYDANGNKLTESWTGNMSGWNFTTQNGGDDGYDDEDRFTAFIQTAKSKTIGLTRSDIGNISNVNLNGTNTGRGYSNIHELTSIGATAQTFDTDGNLTVAQSGVDLAWDEAGMVKSTVVSSTDTAGIEGTNEYGYDASQKRVNKKVTRSGSVVEDTVYIYAGPNCVAEYAKGTAATSPDQEYVYAQAIDSLVMIVRSGGTQKLAVTRNQQWSISSLADNANGTILERYTYDLFGKRTILAADGSTIRTTSSYDNPYGYTSRRHDEESGLMYFRARYYDTATGEFTSQDPLEHIDGMSQYRGYFVLIALDPTGLDMVFVDWPANPPPEQSYWDSWPTKSRPPLTVYAYPKPTKVTKVKEDDHVNVLGERDHNERYYDFDGTKKAILDGHYPIRIEGLDDMSSDLGGYPISKLVIHCHGSPGCFSITGKFGKVKEYCGIINDLQNKNLDQFFSGVKFAKPCKIHVNSCNAGHQKELLERIAELTGCEVCGAKYRCSPPDNYPCDVVVYPKIKIQAPK